MSSRLPTSVFFAILAAGVFQCLHDYPLLPEVLASHFGPSGNANGWMTKPQFFIVYAIALLPALAVEFWAPCLIATRSDDRLKLPNKEYWLAPERRAGTFAYFEGFFAWYGCAFLALMVYAMGLAMRANLEAPARLPTGPIMTAIFGFVLYNVATVAAMTFHFSRTK